MARAGDRDREAYGELEEHSAALRGVHLHVKAACRRASWLPISNQRSRGSPCHLSADDGLAAFRAAVQAAPAGLHSDPAISAVAGIAGGVNQDRLQDGTRAADAERL